jgi:S-(hydroxymethyl)glutathione dehydrogenase / alcohol dehydrogenase
MSLNYRAAVLHQSCTALAIERVSARAPGPADVVVRIRAAGLCHTDLEVMSGSLRYPLPMILGHEAPGPSRKSAAPLTISSPAIT